jgi:tight adherence protein C
MKMLRAGYRGKNAVRIFHAAQFALGLSLLIAIGVIYTHDHGRSPSCRRRLLMSTLLPGRRAITCRSYWVTPHPDPQEEIIDGFPDSAGHDAGLRRGRAVAGPVDHPRRPRKSSAGYPALGEEFEIVAQEVKAGKERVGAARTFGERSGIPICVVFRDHAGAVGHLRHLDRRGAARLCGRNA